jgi:parallel beta-helix repeat protein
MRTRPIRTKKTCRLALEELESRLAPSVYYISPTGSDNNPGTQVSPFQTIQHAADLVNPGDTVLVNNGVYTKPATLSPYSSGFSAVATIWRGGTANNLVTFKSINPYGARIDGQNYTTFSGFMFANVVGYVRIEGFDIYGEGDSTLSVPQGDAIDIYNGGNNVQIVGNNIHDIGHFGTDTADGLDGIFIGNNYLNSIADNNILVENNLIHNIGRYSPGENGWNPTQPYYQNHDHGIYIHEGSDITIINNVFYNNLHGWDIQLYPNPAVRLNILNNTFAFYNPWRDGQIVISSAMTDCNIENNIFYQPSVCALLFAGSMTITNTVVSHNLTYAGTITNMAYPGVTFVNNLDNTDPRFVNASSTSFDFRLQPGSPAIDAGLTLPLVTTDFYGTSRPQGNGYDIGAYELPVTSAVTTHLQIAAGSSSTAGSSFSITVTALNASNGISSGYTGTVRFTSSDLAAVLPTSYTFTAADAGVHTFTGVVLKTAGSQSITATDTVTSSITANASVTVNAAAASTLAVAGYPSTVTAGTSNSFTVTAHDPYGNTATGYTGTVTFSSTDSQAVLPANYTFTNSDAGLHTFSATLRTAGSQTITARDTVTPSITGTQSGITVNAATTSHLKIGAPASATAGSAFSLTITAQDANNNTLTSYLGTIQFTSSDLAAALPTSYTFTAADAGVHTFTGVILKTAGSQSITATDTVTSSITANASVTVNAATASTFAVAGYPSTDTAGTSHNFAVTAHDAYGNTATGYSGTVTFSTTDSQAVLPSNSTLTNGTGQFSATLNTAGTQSLTVTDTTNVSLTGTQGGITVYATVKMLAVAGFPSPITAGVGGSVTVTARDSTGNVATWYTGAVVFSSSDGQAVLPATYIFTAADQGVHTFSATLKTAGTQSIAVKDTATVALSGSEGGIIVNPAAASKFLISAPAIVQSGVAFSLTITVQDAYGNVVTGYTGTIHFKSMDGRASLPADYTFTAADKGMHTFSGLTLRKRGNQTITITDTLNSSIFGSVIVDVLR